jgi:hypothetical protein
VDQDHELKASMTPYLGIVLLFGAVVLWAQEATWPVWSILLGGAAFLLLLAIIPRGRAPKLVLVGATAGEESIALEDALKDAGFDLCECDGPAARPCPFDRGRPCPFGDHLTAAVIVRHAGETAPLPPCTRALFVPSLAVEEDTDQHPEFAGRYARVGWRRGKEDVVTALEHLLVTTA